MRVMKLRPAIVAFLALFVAATVFAHAGHQHSFLGTIQTLHENQLTIETVEHKSVTFTLTDKTVLSKGTATATRADLVAGKRVAVAVENDGKTAKTVKIGS